MSKEKVIRENLRLHQEEAEEYESSKPEIFNRKEEDRILSMIEEVKGLIETDGQYLRALDLGCGTGNMLEKLKPYFDEVMGLDLSEEMLSKARPISRKNENVEIIRGRAAELPFPEGYFDLVSAYSVFHHLPGFANPISEAFRVLKDGGVFYIDHDPVNREDLLVRLYIKFCDVLNGNSKEGLPPYEEEEGLDREFCDYHIHHGDDGGVPTSDIRELCDDVGFEIIRDEEYLSYGSERTNPLHFLLKHFATSEWFIVCRKGAEDSSG